VRACACVLALVHVCDSYANRTVLNGAYISLIFFPPCVLNAASWLITSNIILLNMFIAILSEAYRKVGEEERDHPTETT
jgi:hypothetical protein